MPKTGYGHCYETVKRIFEGKHIRVDWRSALECSANIKYAKPDGTRLVLIDQDPGVLQKFASLVGFQRKGTKDKVLKMIDCIKISWTALNINLNF